MYSWKVCSKYVKKITISELKRLAGDQLTEKQYEKIAQNAAGRDGNNSSSLNYTFYDNIRAKKNLPGSVPYEDYQDYILEQ